MVGGMSDEAQDPAEAERDAAKWSAVEEGLELLQEGVLDLLRVTYVALDEVDRMLKDPRAKAMVARFHREWLHLYRLPGMEKDPSIYPLYDGKLAAAMTEEIDRVTAHIVFETPGHFRNLLDTTLTFVNPKLAQAFFFLACFFFSI